MKRFTFWKCAVTFATTVLVVRTDAAPPTGPEYRVGGFVPGCQVSIEYERDWENTGPGIAQCVGYVRGLADAENKP